MIFVVNITHLYYWHGISGWRELFGCWADEIQHPNFIKIYDCSLIVYKTRQMSRFVIQCLSVWHFLTDKPEVWYTDYVMLLLDEARIIAVLTRMSWD